MPRAAWLVPIFVASGVSGLCFELLWARELAVSLGAGSRAVALVVAVFMAGLASGGALGARAVQRLRRPGRAYALAELAIALCGAAVTRCLPQLENIPGTLQRYVASLPLLLFPAALMGTTYPLLCAAAEDDAPLEGLLYAGNALGAALGCALVGCFAIERFGVLGTRLLASAGNLACALLAFWLCGGWQREPRAQHEPGEHVAHVARAALVMACACGASALAAEVLWTRALLPYLNSSSYAFAAILSVYLVCVALGAAWGARRVRQVERSRMYASGRPRGCAGRDHAVGLGSCGVSKRPSKRRAASRC